MDFPERLKNEDPENLLRALQYFFEQGKIQTVIIGEGLTVQNAREPIFLGGRNNTVNTPKNTSPSVWGVDGYDKFSCEDYEIARGLSSFEEARKIARERHEKHMKTQDKELRDRIFIVHPDKSRTPIF